MDARTNQIIVDTTMPYKPKEIGVFGSYAHNEMGPDSDIDIMVGLDSEISLFDLGELYMELSEKLGNKIDLVTKNGINSIFRKYIERHLILIYSED